VEHYDVRGTWKNRAGLIFASFLAGCYLASKTAALFAINPLKEDVNHEVEAEDAERQKHRQ
jgi:hypothetical protein